MKTIARYRFRFASLNAAASSVASTAKCCCCPSRFTAAIPFGMELCRKPAVLEKTSTRGCWTACAKETLAELRVSRATASVRSSEEDLDMAGEVGGTEARCEGR